MEHRLAAVLLADMHGYSRLMEADESDVLARQKAHRRELIDPEVERSRGRIVKSTGDGLLVEFASAHDAVRCAIEIQTGMQQLEGESPENTRIQYRIGINIGDVVFDDDDIFGDCVNIAARLEGLAKPGGVCVSDLTYQIVQDRLPESFRDLGSQRVKNISRAIRAWQWTPSAKSQQKALSETALSQRVQFCVSQDGTQIAYASIGSGPVVFKAPNWLNHIEYDWHSPVWGPFLADIAKQHRLVRFDQRANGLSDWEVEELSGDAMLADMEAVVEASGVESFALLGMSQGCAVSIRYAVEHPEQVRCLVLMGGYVRGFLKRNSPEQEKLDEAAGTMILRGWGSPDPTYRHLFTSMFMPDATPEQANSFDELQRVSVSPENALRIWEMNAQVDVADLARKVSAPTLVLHCQADRRVPLDEGRRMAAYIPGAQFVTLEGNNHVPTPGTPAYSAFLQELNDFVEKHGN